MAGKPTQLNAWANVDPNKARNMITKAIRKAKGNKEVAAKALGVSYVTLWRHIRSLEIVADVDKICDGFTPAQKEAAANGQ